MKSNLLFYITLHGGLDAFAASVLRSPSVCSCLTNDARIPSHLVALDHAQYLTYEIPLPPTLLPFYSI